jgi:hypothetical protein
MATNKGRTGQSTSSSQQTESSRPGGSGAGSSTVSARGAIDTVNQKAAEVTERVANSAASGFDRTKMMVAEQVRSVGHSIERAIEVLREEDQSGLAQRAESFARKVGEASEYLQRKSARELTQDLDQLARRNPAWFLGTAFVLGLLGARFLKSSGNGGTNLPGGYRGLNQSAGSGSSRYGKTMRPGGMDQWDTGEVGYGTP